MGLFGRIFGGDRGPADPPALRQEIEKAMNGLAAVTDVHDSTWHLGEADWSVDQDTGNIVFTTPQGMQVVAPAQIIGTYNTQDETWLWGWDHPSVKPALANDAKRMLAYGQAHGYAKLTTRKLQITEDEAWELTALAFLICGANGAYRGPAGTALVFMTFGEVQLSKAT
jgi:hypothetical protein